jgi:beta-lactamase regulating signal transducer with metallopeptidase domain
VTALIPWYLIGPFCLEVLTAIILKASIVLLLVGTIQFFCRHLSSARRSAVWSAGFAILIVMPFLVSLFPSWQINQHRLLGTVQPAVSSALESESTAPATVEDNGNSGTVYSTENQNFGIPIPPAEVAVVLLFLVWITGAGVLLVRFLIHSYRARMLTVSEIEYSDPELTDISRSILESADINRSVRMIIRDDVKIPFSWGILNPVIILPGLAEQWDHEQKRSVLLHEYAHIDRRDHLVHLAVEIVRALYWINPLIWFAARRNAVERERACDDFALRNGSRRDVYALHLLFIARSQVASCTSPVVSTMADRSGLIERIRCVLDGQLDRTPVPIRKLLSTVSLAVLLVAPLATFNVVKTQMTIPTLQQCIDDLRRDENPMLRRQAAWWLGEHEDREAVPHLVESLQDDAEDVRLVAAWALGEIKDNRAIRYLAAALEDESPLVREMSVLALGEIENPTALNTLTRVFDYEKDLQRAVIWSLGEISGEEADIARNHAFGVMQEQPRDNEEVWAGRLDDAMVEEVRALPDDFPALLADLESSNADIRRLSAFKLGLFGIMQRVQVIRAVNPLLDSLRDPVPEVRAMATWALDEINPSRWGRSRYH